MTKNLSETLKELDADVACFQETKITKDMMTETLAMVDGYRSYFSYCKKRAGYSGVVTYCKRSIQPLNAVDNLSNSMGDDDKVEFSLSSDILKSLDCEGRAVITQHQLTEPIADKNVLSIVNVYCPCVSGEMSGREKFRMDFLLMLEERLVSLATYSHIVLLGDINIAHKVIDHCDPGEENLFYDEPHRLWFNKLIGESGMLVDSYRHLSPEKRFAYTCWDTKTSARQTNFGTRIDYVLIDKEMLRTLKQADVHSKYMGSDHCPVSIVLDLKITPSTILPPLCSSHRYKKRQQKLTSMFVKKRPASEMDAFSSGNQKEVAVKKPQSITNFFTKIPK